MKVWMVLGATACVVAAVLAQDDLFARFEKAEGDRRTCRANLMVYANAQIAFRVKNGAGFTRDLSLLDELRERPVCPNGGRYSVIVGVPKDSFTMHCSVLRHDAGAIQPSGFSPGVNHELDHPENVEILRILDEDRLTCRANMQTLSNGEMAVKRTKGRFTSDFEDFKEWLDVLPRCPEGGKYSVILGVPKDSFTIHCTVRRHDVGVTEQRGYSPGRNSE